MVASKKYPDKKYEAEQAKPAPEPSMVFTRLGR